MTPSALLTHATSLCRRDAGGRERGFTLIELVVVIIILGVLAAIAAPRYIALSHEARVAAVNAMAGTLRSTAENIRVMCKLDPSCDYASGYQYVVIAGRSTPVGNGWPLTGRGLAAQLETWIDYSGFSTVNQYTGTITFTLDGSPDPLSYFVYYSDAGNQPGPPPAINFSVSTAGC